MKRSEILIKLSKYLVKRDQHLALNSTQSDLLAKRALDFLEKEGMLPPLVPFGDHAIYKAMTFVSTWEDE